MTIGIGGTVNRPGYDENGNYLGALGPQTGHYQLPDGSWAVDNSAYWQKMGYAPGQTAFTTGQYQPYGGYKSDEYAAWANDKANQYRQASGQPLTQTTPVTSAPDPFRDFMARPGVSDVLGPYMPNAAPGSAMAGTQAADPFAGFRTEQLDPNRAFITGAGISELLNPYMQQVRDQTMSDIERQRLLAQTQTDDAARAAKAFGGDRHGVANALTNDAFARASAQQYAGLNAQGFNTAAQLAGQNANNYLQGRGQDIGQNMGFMGGALQQRGQDIGYNLGQTANQLQAYQTAGSLLNQSGMMDWLSLNQAANATGALPSSQSSTQQDGGSSWNNIIGGLFTGLGLLRG